MFYFVLVIFKKWNKIKTLIDFAFEMKYIIFFNKKLFSM